MPAFAIAASFDHGLLVRRGSDSGRDRTIYDSQPTLFFTAQSASNQSQGDSGHDRMMVINMHIALCYRLARTLLALPHTCHHHRHCLSQPGAFLLGGIRVPSPPNLARGIDEVDVSDVFISDPERFLELSGVFSERKFPNASQGE